VKLSPRVNFNNNIRSSYYVKFLLTKLLETKTVSTEKYRKALSFKSCSKNLDEIDNLYFDFVHNFLGLTVCSFLSGKLWNQFVEGGDAADVFPMAVNRGLYSFAKKEMKYYFIIIKTSVSEPGLRGTKVGSFNWIRGSLSSTFLY